MKPWDNVLFPSTPLHKESTPHTSNVHNYLAICLSFVFALGGCVVERTIAADARAFHLKPDTWDSNERVFKPYNP